jgi:hypothetical protein
MTDAASRSARDDLLRSIKNRITELTLSLIPQPSNSREVSLTIRDLERLLTLLEPAEKPVIRSPQASYTRPRSRRLA